MGQTLPHGIYLPDNGERNCYTGLSQNWQKLDNLIGSHGDNVSFSQTLTEGVEIGKITINGEDVSLYHTDYSDKADADNVYTKAEIDTSLNAKQDALSSQQLSNIADVTKKANDADVVHKSGDETISGTKSFSNNISMSGNIVKSSDNSALNLRGSTSDSNGAKLALFGKDHENKGNFYLYTNDGTKYKILRGSASEDSLQWGGKEIDCIDSQGDGWIRYSNGLQICWGSIPNSGNKWEQDFPKPFNSAPCSIGNNNSAFNNFIIAVQSYSTSTRAVFVATAFNGGGITYSGQLVKYIAIGKWK